MLMRKVCPIVSRAETFVIFTITLAKSKIDVRSMHLENENNN